jgi:hypothetical protein
MAYSAGPGQGSMFELRLPLSRAQEMEDGRA